MYRRVAGLLGLGLALCLLAVPASGDSAPRLATVIPPGTLSAAEFADPPTWARPQAYWLTSRNQTLEGSIAQLAEFKRLGLGGVSFEPGGPMDGTDVAGPHVSGPGWPYTYLSEEWFGFLDGVLDAAAELDLSMYLLDVPFTMSGSAQGQVAEPARGGDPSLGWTMLAEVVPGAVYQPVTRPYWLDPLNPDAVERLISLNHELTAERVGEHFGGALQAMWTDEVSFQPSVSPTSFRGDVGSAEREIPWSASFPAYFQQRAGYELTPDLLAHVFRPDPADPASRRVAFDYWDAVSARFAEVYYGGLARWAEGAGVGFIGQLIAEERTTGHFGAEGSYFRPAATPTIASTDLISNNIDVTGFASCTGDACYGITERLASSSAHLYGRDRVHVEFLDLHNPDIKEIPRMIRALVNHGITRGVNLFAFHPYEDEGGGYAHDNVLYEHQRIWNDYTARLQYLTTPAHVHADVAVGYAPEAFWVGDEQDPYAFALASGVVASAHLGQDIVPVELLDDPGTSVTGGEIRIGEQAYRGLVVPDWSVASLSVAQAVEEFVRGGGTLAVSGRLPTMEAQGADGELAALLSGLFGFDPAAPPASFTSHAVGAGHVLWLPGDFTASLDQLDAARVAVWQPLVAGLVEHVEPRAVVSGAPVLPSGLSGVDVLSFTRDGRDGYILDNFPAWAEKSPEHQGYDFDFIGQAARVTLSVPATGVPELWDPETGEVTPIATYRVSGDRLVIPLELPPYGAQAVLLRPGDPSAEPHVAETNLVDVVVDEQGVTGHLPSGAGAPYAVIEQDGRTRWLSATGDAPSPAGVLTPLDPVFDVVYSDGGTEQRRAGSWTLPGTDPAAQPHPWFAGTGTYTASVELGDPGLGGRVLLDLGGAGDVAELSIGGVPVGVRPWPPYVFDITDFVGPGAESLEVAVTTSQAAAFPNDSLYPAGILGPLSVESQPLVTLSF